MLTEERFKLILHEINQKRAVTVTELVKLLNTSESTIRRDLNALHNMGKLIKVHGGATVLDNDYTTEEDDVNHKHLMNVDDKEKVSRYAASLIEENDFIYIDAGTTTEMIIDYITEKRATYVTNGIVHAKKLIQKQCNVYIIGGELKLATEAIVGAEAINSLRKYNFTKGFFGTNGISKDAGYSTPDVKEALVKEEAMKKSKNAYILADPTKFNKISSVTFGELNRATIITTTLGEDKYKGLTEIVEVDK